MSSHEFYSKTLLENVIFFFNDLLRLFFSLQEKPLEKSQQSKLSEVIKSRILLDASKVSRSATNSPFKALSKAPNIEALKAELKHVTTVKQNIDNKAMSEIKNNNKASSNMAVNESDDDDSVFINENKPKKTSGKHKTNAQPASGDASSAMLSNVNVSSSNIKPVAPVAQNHNSRDSNVTSETVLR